MFIELTLAISSKRKVWIRADSILALTIVDTETDVAVSSLSEGNSIQVLESPEYIMGKVSESIRWNR
jgi:hypothetical protein